MASFLIIPGPQCPGTKSQRFSKAFCYGTNPLVKELILKGSVRTDMILTMISYLQIYAYEEIQMFASHLITFVLRIKYPFLLISDFVLIFCCH